MFSYAILRGVCVCCLTLLVNVCLDVRKFLDALEHYNEARKLTPNCAPLHSNAAAALMALGGKDNLLQALQACEEAIALSRNYPKVRL